MRDLLFWIDHLLWCLGNLYLGILRCDREKVSQFCYFILIHTLYRSHLIGFVKLPRKTRIKNHFISLFGVVITILIILVIRFITFLFF